MATLTTEGLNPLNPTERAVAVMTVPDEAMIEVVTAICTNNAYSFTVLDGEGNVIQNPEGPGQFAMRKTLEDYWVNQVKQYKTTVHMNKARHDIDDEVQQMVSQITIGIG